MSESRVRLRKADWHDPRDRRDLLRLRYDIFVHEQGVPKELELDDDEDSATHFLALDVLSGEALGCIRLTRAGKATRLCVSASARRRGIGRALLLRLLEEAREQGFGHVHLHAQTQAAPLYLGAGFTAEGEVFVEAGIPHQRMSLSL